MLAEPGRPAAGQRVAGRRHVADRHVAVGEAQHRDRDPGLGRGALHPVRQVRARLPARGDSRQGLRPGALAGAPPTFKHVPYKRRGVSRGAATRSRSRPKTAPAAAVREVCPAKDKTESAAQGARHGAAGAAARRRARQLRVLPRRCPRSIGPRVKRRRQEHAVPAAAVRVLRRVRRLRRNAVPQAADAAVRRPRGHRERDRLLVDLRRQPADDAVHDQRATAAGRPGRTRCSRTTPSSARHAAGARSARSARPRAAGASSRRSCPPGSPTRSSPPISATEAGIQAQRERVAAAAQRRLGERCRIRPRRRDELEPLADYLVKKSVWIVGGDGWAYDIGYGGLDHVLASGANVNVLVLDTEVYSNTGGQESKATPIGAVAKFAVGRQARRQEGPRPDGDDLRPRLRRAGRVGRQRRADAEGVLEAEAYDGPSLIIAYSHCIAHGYDMANGLEHQQLAVESGYWPLYRYDPRRATRREPAGARFAGAEGGRLDADGQRNALPAHRSAGSRALPRLVARAQQQIQDGSRSIRSWPAGREATHEADDALPRADAGASVHAGRLSARGSPRHGAAARRRRRLGDRDALAVRRADQPRALPAASSCWPCRTRR